MMKVLKKQYNSHRCFVCGVDNEAGLKMPFYEMENGSLVSMFNFHEHHQSYPQRTHGGVAACVLDEIIGRAIWISEPTTWGVTIQLSIRYRKPIPYGVPLKAIGEITKTTNRTFAGTGKILDQDGNVLVEAEATYFKLKLDQITNNHDDDINVFVDDNITEIA